jgi:hypothetical protein
MIIVKSLVSLPTKLVALTVKLNVPVMAGIPNTVPFAENSKPYGKLPLIKLHVIGEVPCDIKIA